MVFDIKSVLVLDAIGRKSTEIFTRNGIQVTKKGALTEKELMEEIINYDALLVQSLSKVTFDVLRAGKNLKVVANATQYTTNIDVRAAENRKITVINACSASPLIPCEFTCGLAVVLSKTRELPGADETIHSSGSELNGKKLVIVGTCKDARQVVARLREVGMKVIHYDPCLTEKRRNIWKKVGVRSSTFWPAADYVIIYTKPFETYRPGIISKIIGQCRRSVQMLIVGQITADEADQVHTGLGWGKIEAAAFDLYEETSDWELYNSPVFFHPKVLTTLHLGPQTEAAIEHNEQVVAEQIVNLCNPGTYNTPFSVVVQGNMYM